MPPLAVQLRSDLGAPEASTLVYASLETNTPNPWHHAAAQVQRGLADRGLLETIQVVQFGFVKTQAYRLTNRAATLAAQGPTAVVQAVLDASAQRHPTVWTQLGEQIDSGLRQRLASAPVAGPRRLDDDE